MNATDLRSSVKPFAAGLLLFLFASGCVRERSPITGEHRYYAYSWEQEQKLGREADQQLVQQLGVYEDAELTAYVDRVGQQVLAESDLRKPGSPEEYRSTPFQFRVMDSPVVNAFALPGGYVYVTRGLLSHLQNEAQLAVVLGHEIGHVAARHASRQALTAQAGQLGLIAGAIVGSQVLDDPQAAGNVLNLGGTLFQLLLTSYSRDAERESDQLAVQYASREGYDAAEGSHFFRSLKRMAAQQQSVIPPWQSTHPDPGEREQTIQRLAREMQDPTQQLTVGEEDYLRRLEGMVLGEDPREGFVREGSFYHPQLRFQFPVPAGWNVQNQKAVVLLVPPNRAGVLALEIAPAKTAQEAANRLAQVQGIQVVRSEPLQAQGLSGMRVTAQANTQGGVAALVNYFIEYDQRVYSLLGYSSAQNFEGLAQAFEGVAMGFQPLRDPALLNVQPARLAVVPVAKAAPFRSFLPADLPPGLTPDNLAILNQVELDESISVGRRLKLPNSSMRK